MKIRCKVCGSKFEKKNVRAVTCDKCLSFDKSKLAGLLKKYKKIFNPSAVLSKAYITGFYNALYSDEIQTELCNTAGISKGSIHKISVKYSSNNFVPDYIHHTLINFKNEYATVIGNDIHVFKKRCSILIDKIEMRYATTERVKNHTFVNDVLVDMGLKHYLSIKPIVNSLDLLCDYDMFNDVSFMFKKSFIHDIISLIVNGLDCEEKALTEFDKYGSVK